MLIFAADEDFNFDIVRGVRRRDDAIDILTIQEAGMSGRRDPDVLAWAAGAGRVLLTHDVSTMSSHAYERVARGLLMPGVFEVSQHLPIGQAIEEILLLAHCSIPREWEGQVRHLPLR